MGDTTTASAHRVTAIENAITRYEDKTATLVARLRELADKVEREAAPRPSHVRNSESAWAEHAGDLVQEILRSFPELGLDVLVTRATSVDAAQREYKQKGTS